MLILLGNPVFRIRRTVESPQLVVEERDEFHGDHVFLPNDKLFSQLNGEFLVNFVFCNVSHVQNTLLILVKLFNLQHSKNGTISKKSMYQFQVAY